MNQGILFYSNHKDPLPLFVIAVHSLRKFYSGNIHLVLGQQTPDFFKNILKAQNEVSYSEVKRRYFTKIRRSNIYLNEWCEKPFVIKNESPFNLTLYYDCDHVFYDHMDIHPFDATAEHGLVTAINKGYANRVQLITDIINRINISDWESIEKANGGCIGFNKECPNIIDAWVKYMSAYRRKGFGVVRANCEEFALATIIKEGLGKRIPEEYSYGYPRNRKRRGLMKVPNNVKALHYCVKRYMVGNLWNEAFQKAIEDDYLQIRSRFSEYEQCNEYLKEIHV